MITIIIHNKQYNLCEKMQIKRPPAKNEQEFLNAIKYRNPLWPVSQLVISPKSSYKNSFVDILAVVVACKVRKFIINDTVTGLNIHKRFYFYPGRKVDEYSKNVIRHEHKDIHRYGVVIGNVKSKPKRVIDSRPDLYNECEQMEYIKNIVRFNKTMNFKDLTKASNTCLVSVDARTEMNIYMKGRLNCTNYINMFVDATVVLNHMSKILLPFFTASMKNRIFIRCVIISKDPDDTLMTVKLFTISLTEICDSVSCHCDDYYEGYNFRMAIADVLCEDVVYIHTLNVFF